MTRNIGVLALQGAFIEHAHRLETLGAHVVELRESTDLGRPLDGLVLPGGESTVQAKLLHRLDMFQPLKSLIEQGLPTLGTCAGAILLAKDIQGEGDLDGLDHNVAEMREEVMGLRTLPITVRRNAYGRQLGSFHANSDPVVSTEPADPADLTNPIGSSVSTSQVDPAASTDLTVSTDPAETDSIPLTFIRAPRIVSCLDEVAILAAYRGDPVAVRFKNQIATTFHPELDDDPTIYRLFLSLMR